VVGLRVPLQSVVGLVGLLAARIVAPLLDRCSSKRNPDRRCSTPWTGAGGWRTARPAARRLMAMVSMSLLPRRGTPSTFAARLDVPPSLMPASTFRLRITARRWTPPASSRRRRPVAMAAGRKAKDMRVVQRGRPAPTAQHRRWGRMFGPALVDVRALLPDRGRGVLERMPFVGDCRRRCRRSRRWRRSGGDDEHPSRSIRHRTREAAQARMGRNAPVESLRRARRAARTSRPCHAPSRPTVAWSADPGGACPCRSASTA